MNDIMGMLMTNDGHVNDTLEQVNDNLQKLYRQMNF